MQRRARTKAVGPKNQIIYIAIRLRWLVNELPREPVDSLQIKSRAFDLQG